MGIQGPEEVRRLIQMLLMIQELSFALMEHEAAESKASSQEIRDSLERLSREIPAEWLKVVHRLQGGGQPAVVPASDGFCSYCRIQVPTQLFQEVVRGSRIHQCPCCARILYVPEGGGFHLGTSMPRTARGGLARFSSKDLVVPSLSGRTRDEVLEELVGKMSEAGWLTEPRRVLKAAIEREELVSTAVDYGLAFPHVRGVEGGGLVFALGLSRKGVRFAPGSKKLSRIFFFSVIPQAASPLYLRIVAGLVKTLREKEARQKLLGCKDSNSAWETLLELTSPVME